MFLVEDVRMASPSQLALRDAHIKRRAAWEAKAPIHAQRKLERISQSFAGVEKLMSEQSVNNPIAPAIPAIYELPQHVRGNAKSVVRIVSKVCAHQFNVDAAEITKAKRTKQIVLARHAAFWICKEVTQWSLPEVGRRLGKKDHTTILHGIRKMNRRINAEPEFSATLLNLKAAVIERMQPADDRYQAAVSSECERGLSK